MPNHDELALVEAIKKALMYQFGLDTSAVLSAVIGATEYDNGYDTGYWFEASVTLSGHAGEAWAVDLDHAAGVLIGDLSEKYGPLEASSRLQIDLVTGQVTLVALQEGLA